MVLEGLRIFQGSFSLWQRFIKHTVGFQKTVYPCLSKQPTSSQMLEKYQKVISCRFQTLISDLTVRASESEPAAQFRIILWTQITKMPAQYAS